MCRMCEGFSQEDVARRSRCRRSSPSTGILVIWRRRAGPDPPPHLDVHRRSPSTPTAIPSSSSPVHRTSRARVQVRSTDHRHHDPRGRRSRPATRWQVDRVRRCGSVRSTSMQYRSRTRSIVWYASRRSRSPSRCAELQALQVFVPSPSTRSAVFAARRQPDFSGREPGVRVRRSASRVEATHRPR